MRTALKYVGGVMLAVVGLAGILLAWGLAEPYFVDTEEHEARIPGLPASWDGKRVGVISDWQIGMWLDNTLTMQRSVELLVEERPEVVLITGDFVFGESREADEDIRKMREFVRPLSEAGVPTYAVLGNHDYRMAYPYTEPNFQAAERVREALEAEGVRVLKNEAVALEAAEGASGEPLYLVGIGANWPGEDRPAEAVSQAPDGSPRLVMMHNPNSFEALPAWSAPVAVAGHTHGGQVGLPGTPEWSYMTYAEKDKVHADGWIEGYGEPGNELYVNRGIGFSVAPIRIGARPEVTLLNLRPAGS